jgi:hypothetical protein
MKEEDLRALLDERGILRVGAFKGSRPDRSSGYAVFAQRPNVMLDLPALKNQAQRFFGAKIGLTVDKSYFGAQVPEEDIAHLIVSTDDGTANGTRLIYGRAADTSDHAAAESAERMQGTSGMALLAQRCATLWIVAIESAGVGGDRAALTIAAILASHFLGPILSPDGIELFGVRTARMKLEKLAGQPFR